MLRGTMPCTTESPTARTIGLPPCGSTTTSEMNGPGSTPKPPAADPGWRRARATSSLPEVHRSIVVPAGASFWRKYLAFAGPGFMVAVGYMDPGNWATDLAGGAKFGYTLLSVILISNLMAILLQHLCVKLGIAT